MHEKTMEEMMNSALTIGSTITGERMTLSDIQIARHTKGESVDQTGSLEKEKELSDELFQIREDGALVSIATNGTGEELLHRI